MEEAIPIPVWLLTSLIAILIATSIHWLFLSSKNDKSNGIPWAPGAVPMLGHALKYRSNPAQFLIDAKEKVGDVFQLNLAGKHMIVVCGPHFQRAVASAPESVMSARRAVADIGFEEMLGHENVYRGTDLHKGIVKGLFRRVSNDGSSVGDLEEKESLVAGYIDACRNALRAETSTTTPFHEQLQEVEFITMIRRVTLRAATDHFIGPFFLNDWEFDFIGEFTKFQDDLEDATAKSAVIPKAFSLPLLLWPLSRRRQRLERSISERLEKTMSMMPKEDIGFWLAAVKDIEGVCEIAHFIVGLLFAAHKNPAIGAAQSYLMLQERATSTQQQTCIDESKTLVSNPSYQHLRESCITLNRLCMEALRLTAHSIGGLRTTCKDFALDDDNGNNFIIPRGSTVALAHIPLSLNAKVWKDPNNLDLDLMSNNRSKQLYEDEYAFTVFSHGMHKCPGQRLAMIMLPCTVALLLTEYIIKLPEHIPPLCFERQTLAQRAGPICIVLGRKDVNEDE